MEDIPAKLTDINDTLKKILAVMEKPTHPVAKILISMASVSGGLGLFAVVLGIIDQVRGLFL